MDYRIIELLDGILGQSKIFSKGEHYYFCPFCHHYKPKFAINVIKEKWQCWKCNERGGSLLQLLRKLKVDNNQIVKLRRLIEAVIPESELPTEHIDVSLPNEFIPLWETTGGYKSGRARKYLSSRNIGIFDIIKYQIGYCETGDYFNRIIIPSYDNNNILNFFLARDFMDKAPLPYANPPVSKDIIALENQINWNYPIVLVEGIFDAMATKRNVIPLLGKTLSQKLQKKIIHIGVEDIYLALDNDALKETTKIAEHYMKEGINVWIIDLDGKDPSVIGSEKMYSLIKTATKLTFSSLLQLKMRLSN